MSVEAPVAGRPPREITAAARWGAVASLLVFAALLSGGRPAGLFEAGPFTSDFFDAQAHALLEGHLDVDPDVPGIEGFVHDGRTQLYYGLAPAVLRLPVASLTDRLDGRLTQASMLAGWAVGLWAAHRILWWARVRARGTEPVQAGERWIAAGFTAAIGLSSPLLFLGSRPIVYHEVELWGAATALVAVVALLAWWDDPTPRQLTAASAAVLVCLHTRASVGSGVLAALGLVTLLGLLWRRVPLRAAGAACLAVAVPLASYAAVNQARFGHPFSIPFDEQGLSQIDEARQATLEATGGSLFGPEFAPTALVTYLRPDGVRLQPLFPWITFREGDTAIGSAVFDTIDRSASLPVVAPALLLTGAIGLIALLRRPRRDPWLALTVGTAAGLSSTLTIAFIAHRYLADFTPPLVVAAAVGTWVVAGWARRRSPAVRTSAVGGVALLGLGGLLVNAALGLQAQRLLVLPERGDRLGFVDLQYDLHERISDSLPPDVVRTDDLRDRPGRRGSVALVGRCKALYWHDGERWWPLELAEPLQWELDGDLAPGRSALVTGPDWSVVGDVDDDQVQFAYVRDGRVLRQGPTLPLDEVRGQHLTVRLDPVNAEAFVEVDGELALVAWLVGVADPRVAPGWDTSAPRTPLCDDLSTRLDGPQPASRGSRAGSSS